MSLISAMLRFPPPPLMCLWVEPTGGKRKSADVERETYTLIYPDPSGNVINQFFWQNIIEPSMTHLNKKTHSFCQPSKQVWLRKRCRKQLIGAADSCTNMRMAVRQKHNLSTYCPIEPNCAISDITNFNTFS
jgi:hypothetical protein